MDRFPRPLLVALPLALGLAGSPARSHGPTLPVNSSADDDTVAAWRASARPPAVRVHRDTVEKHGGAASAHVVATPQNAPPPAPTGERGGRGGGGGGGGPRVAPIYFAQSLNARPYRERRVRVSLWVRTRLPDKPAPKMPVSQANVFMRIENEDGTFTLYDGSVSPIFGSTEWTRKFVVLEVPPDAYAITFGVAVTGDGEVWVDDVLFEDQSPAMGPYQKQPMMPPERLQQMTPEQVEQVKQRLTGAAARMAERPAEVVNGDFELR
jgi:hypothetical protein